MQVEITLRERYRRVLTQDYRVSTQVLACFRVMFGLFLLWAGGVPDLGWLADYPNAFYDPPPGLPALWRGLPGTDAVLFLEVLWIALVVALTVGWRTPAVSIALPVVAIVGNSMLFSIGKIDHSILIWVIPLLLAGSGWGDHWSIDERRNGARQPGTSAAPLGVLSLLLGLAFFTAAVPKLTGNWLDPSTQASRRYFEENIAQQERTNLLASVAERVDAPWIWELADIATIALELAIPLAVLHPRLLRKLLVPLAAFHLTNLLVLNISFAGILLVYVLLSLATIPSRQVRRVSHAIDAHRGPLAGLIVGAAAFGAAANFIGSSAVALVLGGWLGLPNHWRDVLILLPLVALVVGLNGMPERAGAGGRSQIRESPGRSVHRGSAPRKRQSAQHQ